MLVTSLPRCSRSFPRPAWKRCSAPSATSPVRRIRSFWPKWLLGTDVSWIFRRHSHSSSDTDSCSEIVMGGGGGNTPEELATLLEDALLLRDADAVARLFDD